jgi:hypothetical protein
MQARVSLSLEDFKKLVAGKIVTKRAQDGIDVQIILSDIGFDQMFGAIADAVESGNAS